MHPGPHFFWLVVQVSSHVVAAHSAPAPQANAPLLQHAPVFSMHQYVPQSLNPATQVPSDVEYPPCPGCGAVVLAAVGVPMMAFVVVGAAKVGVRTPAPTDEDEGHASALGMQRAPAQDFVPSGQATGGPLHTLPRSQQPPLGVQ